jgi:CheY-like chemotaxis protein
MTLQYINNILLNVVTEMHFNKKNDTFLENYLQNIVTNQVFLAIDTLTVDDHLRLTLTKRIRNILPIQSGDEIAVFQNKGNRHIIFNVQRKGSIVDVWICKRVIDDYDKNDRSNDIELDSQSNLNTSTTSSRMEKVPQIFNYNFNYYAKKENNNIQKDRIRYDNINDVINTKNDNDNTNGNSAKTIMIVDDESDVLVSLSAPLEDIGMRVETFANSAEALLRFIESLPAYFGLVILDIKMPGLNGLQLYKIMKAFRRDTKILFVSALDYAEEFIRLLPGTNSNSILTKPIDTQHFIQKVKEMLL